MIDHVSVGVSDLERAARFYEAALAPLGLSRLVTRPATIGFGKSLSRILDQSARRHGAGRRPKAARISAFAPRSTGDVDAFHAAALRPAAAPTARRVCVRMIACSYYAAFVIDPDGNRIEAVTFPSE